MGRPLIVVFLIDALGWEVARRFGFCKDLLEERTALGTVLGYSSAAIPSLLSGSTPAEHGVWAMYRLAAGPSPFGYLRFLPKLPHALEWRLRGLVRRLTDRAGKVTAYYDLYEIPIHLLGHFDLAQRIDPYQPGGLERETVFDRMAADGVAYRLWYYDTPETENKQSLLSSMGGDVDVLFMYTAEFDALQHKVGIFDEAVKTKLESYERFVAEVLSRGEEAGRDVSAYVISDHGMTGVHEAVDLWGEVERRGYKLGKDYLAFYDSTMARLWCGEEVRRAAAEIITGSGWGRELSDAELESYGCLFPDRSYGATIFLMNPGVMIVPSFMGREKIAAMHGYDPGDEYSLGSFLTNDRSGPGPTTILEFKSYLLSKIPGKKS